MNPAILFMMIDLVLMIVVTNPDDGNQRGNVVHAEFPDSLISE